MFFSRGTNRAAGGSHFARDRQKRDGAYGFSLARRSRPQDITSSNGKASVHPDGAYLAEREPADGSVSGWH